MSFKLAILKIGKPLAMAVAGVGVWYGNKQWNVVEETLHINPHDKKDMLRVFDEIDTHKTNSISPDELKEALHKTGKDLSSRQLKAIFDVADVDHDGTLSRKEWVNALEHHSQVSVGSNVEHAKELSNKNSTAPKAIVVDVKPPQSK
jgi:hypothetical protein